VDLPLDACRLLGPASAPVTVLTAGMDERKLALLRLAFRMHAALGYRLAVDAADAQPDLALVDIDGEGWPLWQRFRQAHPQLPAAIVSAAPPERAPAAILKKPLRVEQLFPLLRELQEKPVADTAWSPPSAPPPKPSARPARPAVIERFDPASGLLGQACLLQRQRQDALILADDEPIVAILGSRNEARPLCGAARLREICQIDAAAILPTPLTRAPLPAEAPACPLKPLLWQLAIWSARGRLIRQIQADTPLRLRHWPNLTRLAPIPDALRVSALLCRSTVNLRVIARLLRIAPADLFAFLAAAHCIGALDIPQEGKLGVIASPPVRGQPPQSEAAPDASRRGLLSRLLRKITGL
jgi:hypothetical protein